ncbi:MAG: toll/interleukin-1 receptor domain-containing protein [Pseudomonadales bacterium]
MHSRAAGPLERYQAFISYAHADERFAAWLHSGLERFRVPRQLLARLGRSGNRLTPVFRDRDELASSASLSAAIEAALSASAYLIVVCSPAAAASRWVDAEVSRFRELVGGDRIVTVIAPGAGDVPLSGCLPEALRERAEEPLAADARPGADGRRRALAKVAAALLGVGFDELWRREAQRRRRRAALALVAGLGAAVVAGGLLLQTRDAALRLEQQRAQASALVGFMVDDLARRLAEFERVGELDAGLAQALTYFDSQDIESLDDDLLRKYRIALRGVGIVRIRQGQPGAALERFRRAADVDALLVARNGDSAENWFELSKSAYYIGEAHWELQDVATAAAQIREALGLAEKAAALAPENFAMQLEVVFDHNNMGAVSTRLGDYTAAVKYLEGALAMIETLRSHPDALADELTDQEVEAVSWLTEITPALGRFDEAFRWHERELALRRTLLERTGNVEHSARLADALSFYAKTLAAVGDVAGARTALQENVAISDKLVRADPGNAFWRERYVMGKAMLAEQMFLGGDRVLAEQTLDEAAAGMDGLLAEQPDTGAFHLDRAYADELRALMLLDRSPAQARAHAGAAVRVLQERLAAQPENRIAAGQLASSLLLAHLAELGAGLRPAPVRLEQALAALGPDRGADASPGVASLRVLILMAQGRAAEAGVARQRLTDTGFASARFRYLLGQLDGRDDSGSSRLASGASVGET